MLERKNSSVMYQNLIIDLNNAILNPDLFKKVVVKHVNNTLPYIEPAFIMQSEVLAKWVFLAVNALKRERFTPEEFVDMPKEVLAELDAMPMTFFVNNKDGMQIITQSMPTGEIDLVGSLKEGLSVLSLMSDLKLNMQFSPGELSTEDAITMKHLNTLSGVVNLYHAGYHTSDDYKAYVEEIKSSIPSSNQTHAENALLAFIDYTQQEANKNNRSRFAHDDFIKDEQAEGVEIYISSFKEKIIQSIPTKSETVIKATSTSKTLTI